ncbi:hypothetical protein C1H46_010554 [Malus baccata]|uniref:Uncharacterized protein n=1 Tax=Malus baccata TaxID=106549 RepID=A0A540N003_MALBA|nr:hypothetical protein C1H46_010554 [Malus baccata]
MCWVFDCSGSMQMGGRVYRFRANLQRQMLTIIGSYMSEFWATRRCGVAGGAMMQTWYKSWWLGDDAWKVQAGSEVWVVMRV